jgi:hypothetical protein
MTDKCWCCPTEAHSSISSLDWQSLSKQEPDDHSKTDNKWGGKMHLDSCVLQATHHSIYIVTGGVHLFKFQGLHDSQQWIHDYIKNKEYVYRMSGNHAWEITRHVFILLGYCTPHSLVVGYSCFYTLHLSHLQKPSSPRISWIIFWTAWPLKMGQTCCLKRYPITNLSCATSQNSKDLSYTMAEAWNLMDFKIHHFYKLVYKQKIVANSGP